MKIEEIQNKLAVFAEEREWDQFHSPKNISMALAVEAGELLEIFQWMTESDSMLATSDSKLRGRIEEEIADIQINLLRLADKLSVDVESAVNRKIESNAQKYPIDRFKGSSRKYNEESEWSFTKKRKLSLLMTS